MTSQAVQVTCYSGHSYAQEPRVFTWQGERHLVAEIERTWRTPSALHFRVRAEDGTRCELIYEERADEWRLYQHIDKEVSLDA